VLFVVPRQALAGADGEDLARALAAGRAGFNQGSVLVVDPASALEEVQGRLRQDRRGPRQIEAVCLVGADPDLPMTRLPDTTTAQPGREVLTDNFFGALSMPSEEDRLMGDVLPEVPVSRIPTLSPREVARLVSATDGLASTWAGGFAVSAGVWRDASAAVLEMVTGGSGPHLEISPPFVEEHVRQRLGPGTARAYFNVHGSEQSPVWVGDDEMGHYPVVLQPRSVAVAPDAVVVSEACYGAAIFRDEPAISTTFLERGAGCFLGSTIVAWGPSKPPPDNADLIASGFFQALDNGLPLGLALLQAKARIAETALEANEALNPVQHNTILSFVAYGAPLTRAAAIAAPHGGALSGRPGPQITHAPGPGRPGSALDAIRRRMAGGASAPGSALGLVRQRLRARISPGAYELMEHGRRTLADLPRMFRASGQIQRELGLLLGGKGIDELTWRSYRFRGRNRAMVTASTGVPHGTSYASLIVDPDGNEILARYVSR
jgi:hypothetical protein